MTAAATVDPAASAFAPFASRPFAMLWGATVLSQTGTWMNDVGAGWLMTTLAPSPAMVALVQAATTLPVFLFALPAGALADVVDRRRLLLVVNALMALTATALAAIVAAGAMTAPLLLLFTFLLGTGAAFIAPAWQAVVPGLVPREQLTAAVSLNGVGVNVSRAIGPAVAGLLIVALGLAAPFVANAFSFVGVLLALWWWRGEKQAEGALPPEHVLPAMVAGLRFARRSPGLRRVILRAVAFFLFASCYWAMLPLVARDVLGGGSGLYGVLLGCVGAGAVGGALLLPRLRARIEINRLVLLGGLGTALAMGVLAVAASPVAAAAAAALAGASWIACLSSFQVAAQSALPNWVRARGLSLFLTAFFGAMAGGALVWGLIAERAGVPAALMTAAVGLCIAAILSLRVRLAPGAEDLSPSLHWPAPPHVPPERGDVGPVMVTLDYAVPDAARPAFAALIARLRDSRLRDGGYAWRLTEALERPGVLTESFLVASWLEHQRQHARVTGEERRLQDAIAALLGTRPEVRHHLPANPVAKETAP
ncbi:MFS transporter [Rubrimonas cliftonensis]|uniref:Predicted arabinose efflux permease, MFS family n=1 Tax=Rubrimonas cliftonensis TaxID=89524 RepID=A0A1H4FRD7_9RHOB|nr:MFS transporter [Rubrimonas cliftonensis]SEA99943.1 Predicted arabinose efflux permease, MFS family [Rubrimonas cliftonensis]